MPEEIHRPNGEIEHPDVSREETDASFRAILFLLIGAAVVALVIYLLITAFFFGWKDHETAVKKSSFPLAPAAPTDPRALSPLPAGEPRLEQVDRLAGVETPNVYDRQAAKEKILNSFDLKEEKGFVHIPIERAIEALESIRLENKQIVNKLPVRAAPPADQMWRQEGLYDSGESNSGREFRGKPR